MSKKTVELIIAQGNDYVITVKANQPCLYRQIINNTQQSEPISSCSSSERRSDRYTKRTVSVFDNLAGISSEWSGLKTIIKVERSGTRKGKPYYQLAYYISSLAANASTFQQGIRDHWGIENRLHWVKDVVLQEDNSSIHAANAAANLSLLRSMAINILRHHGYSSITRAGRLIGHDFERLFLLLQ